MGYEPGVVNRSGEIFANAISGTIDDLEKLRREREQMAKEDQYNDMVVSHAYQNGQVSEDELNKYNAMSHSKKTGFAAGIAANIVSDWKQQSQQTEIAQRQAQTQLAQAQLNQTGPFAPDPDQVAIQRAQAAHLAAQTQLAQAQAQNLQSGGDEPVVTDPLKINDKDIPGIGVNRKTGQYVYFGESGIERDPKTGALGTRDTKGNFKPMSAQQITGMAMDPNNPVQQSPTSTPTPGILQRMFGGGGSASPAPSATPSQTPTAAVRINSKADYDALPSGSLYIAPDGSTRRKP
jgi:hypothetical protein